MTDSETLRAAAEVIRGRMQRPTTAHMLEEWANGLDTEDAAKLKAAERDRQIGHVAYRKWYERTNRGTELPFRTSVWDAVGRAVREAIEAEQ